MVYFNGKISLKHMKKYFLFSELKKSDWKRRKCVSMKKKTDTLRIET